MAWQRRRRRRADKESAACSVTLGLGHRAKRETAPGSSADLPCANGRMADRHRRDGGSACSKGCVRNTLAALSAVAYEAAGMHAVRWRAAGIAPARRQGEGRRASGSRGPHTRFLNIKRGWPHTTAVSHLEGETQRQRERRKKRKKRRKGGQLARGRDKGLR